ncbi:hypothetical protein ACWB3S_06170 [Acinetobacter baumannii]
MAVENTAFFIGVFMTVSISERLSPLYEGNGINTRFDFTFRVFDQEDATGVSVKHQVGADFENVDESLYTVTLNEDNLGGYITFLNAPVVGFQFYIAGETPVDQALDITNYDNFYPDAIELSLDKLTSILQEWAHSLGLEKLSRNKALEILDQAIQDQIREQGLALDQIDSFANDLANRLQNIVIEKGWLAEFIADGEENQKQINASTIRRVTSIAKLLEINNPKNGSVVFVEQYYSDQQKKGAGRNYTYNASRQLENDGCTIINGWVGEKKGAYTVWDWGYSLENKELSNAAIQKWLTSDYACELLAEELSNNDFLDITVSKNKTIFGAGKGVSILNKVKIVLKNGSFIANNFSSNKLGLNYALRIENYDQVFVDNFESEENYDACLIWHANSDKSKAIIQNSTARRSARIGFTTDVNSRNVTFINCDSVDSRQGFHSEAGSDTLYQNCNAIRCGLDSPTPPTDQPSLYAGGFRFHAYKNVTLENCHNIDPAGRSIDWLGGGGENLTIRNSNNLHFTTDDVGPTDPDSSYTYSNIEIDSCKSFSLINQLRKSRFTGIFKIKNVDAGNVDCLSGAMAQNRINSITLCVLENLNLSRMQVDTNSLNASLTMSNVSCKSAYSSIISGFEYINAGDISYNWIAGDESQYPQLGFRFDAKNAKSFVLNSFSSIGRGGGSQISLENIDSSKFIGGYIGRIMSINEIDAFEDLDVNKYNIVIVGRNNKTNIATRTIASTTADLQSMQSAINTNKYLGKEVYNSTISKFMKSTGSEKISTWVATDGSTVITPT